MFRNLNNFSASKAKCGEFTESFNGFLFIIQIRSLRVKFCAAISTINIQILRYRRFGSSSVIAVGASDDNRSGL